MENPQTMYQLRNKDVNILTSGMIIYTNNPYNNKIERMEIIDTPEIDNNILRLKLSLLEIGSVQTSIDFNLNFEMPIWTEKLQNNWNKI